MRDADDMKGLRADRSRYDAGRSRIGSRATAFTNGFAAGVLSVPTATKSSGLQKLGIRIVSFSVTCAQASEVRARFGGTHGDRADFVERDDPSNHAAARRMPQQLSLQKDVDVTVNVEVAYPWAVSGKVTYKILK